MRRKDISDSRDQVTFPGYAGTEYIGYTVKLHTVPECRFDHCRRLIPGRNDVRDIDIVMIDIDLGKCHIHP